MPKILTWLLRFYMPGVVADDSADRGDDFTPTDDDGEGDTPRVKKEPEAKDEPEEPEEPEAKKEEDKPKRKDDRMPLARHKEILEKERARREELEQQLASVKKGEEVAKTNEQLTEAENQVLELEKQYNKAIVDGESDKAAELMAKIRRTERNIIETKARFETQAAEGRAYERVQYDMTLERLEEAYPQINQDGDEFDKDLADSMIAMRDGYITRGMSRTEALKRAAKVLLKPATKRQEHAVETDVRVDKDDVAEALAKERKTAAVKKNAEAAGKQPPSTAKVGIDSDKVGGSISAKDVMKMKQEDFAKLDEATLAKMRGDVLA